VSRRPTQLQRAVLNCLVDALRTDGEPRSAHDISRALESAVSADSLQHIVKRLRRIGYDIVAVPGEGYCLISAEPGLPTTGARMPLPKLDGSQALVEHVAAICAALLNALPACDRRRVLTTLVRLFS
jgi:biotin operon repressor